MKKDKQLTWIDNLIKEKNWSQAILEIEEVIEISPTPKLHYQYAYCLHSIRNPFSFQKALIHYNKAEELKHLPFWIHYSRGGLQMLMGNIEEALIDLEKALEIKPGYEDVEFTLQRVKRLKNSFNPENGLQLSSPVFISTVPKSGTHLLKNILFNLFGPKVILPGWLSPDLVNEEQLVKAGHFENRIYMGHLFYSNRLAQKIRDYPKILLVRDPRAQIISHTWHYEQLDVPDDIRPDFMNLSDWNTKISALIYGIISDNPDIEMLSVQEKFEKTILNWRNEPNHKIVKFEDLVGDEFGGSDQNAIETIENLLRFCSVHPKPGAVKGIYSSGKDPKNSGSFRKGSVDKWRKEFTPAHYAQFAEVAPNLLGDLEYVEFQDKDTLDVINGSEPNTQYLRYSWLAKQFFSNQNFKNLNIYLKYLLEQKPAHPLWNFYQGIAFFQNKQYKDALKHLSAAEESHYNKAKVEFYTFQCLLRTGRLIAAFRYLRNAIRDAGAQYSITTILKKGISLLR